MGQGDRKAVIPLVDDRREHYVEVDLELKAFLN